MRGGARCGGTGGVDPRARRDSSPRARHSGASSTDADYKLGPDSKLPAPTLGTERRPRPGLGALLAPWISLSPTLETCSQPGTPGLSLATRAPRVVPSGGVTFTLSPAPAPQLPHPRARGRDCSGARAEKGAADPAQPSPAWANARAREQFQRCALRWTLPAAEARQRPAAPRPAEVQAPRRAPAPPRHVTPTSHSAASSRGAGARGPARRAGDLDAPGTGADCARRCRSSGRPGERAPARRTSEARRYRRERAAGREWVVGSGWFSAPAKPEVSAWLSVLGRVCVSLTSGPPEGPATGPGPGKVLGTCRVSSRVRLTSPRNRSPDIESPDRAAPRSRGPNPPFGLWGLRQTISERSSTPGRGGPEECAPIRPRRC
ncbi:EZH inhibitory protein [Suncus etruscus]|uniref:EZH inhibitory protein n=1 Tax=Suncus etruscus TaxID=109475 RepID=UPI00210FB49F|nr:EZH inhibitory protein [Suncus etruscus]